MTEANASVSRSIMGDRRYMTAVTAGFTNLLIVSPFAEGTYWFLQSPLVYEDSASNEIVVSRYFVTDFASIPRFLWLLLPKWDGYGMPSVVHDYLYWEQQGHNRYFADNVLLSAMKDQSVAKWKRVVIYRTLRLFGFFAWRGNAKQRAANGARYVHGDQLPTPTEPWSAYEKRTRNKQ
jgi:hypothetical protein